MKYFKFYLLAIAVIIIDQIIKMLVHFNMEMHAPGQIKLLGDIFSLYYLTNEGMAFGVKIAGKYGKVFLTIFRIIAMAGIGYYLYYSAKRSVNQGFLWCLAAILGGAIGNLIDSVFYGIIPAIDNAPYDAPMKLFHGQVIDMFYIHIWEGFMPKWFPLFGGEYMSLWPVFNFADASIFVSVCIILIFQKRFFKDLETSNSAS